eukprot:gene30366-35371_t
MVELMHIAGSMENLDSMVFLLALASGVSSGVGTACTTLEGYHYMTHRDHYGDDLKYAYTEDPYELAALCTADPGCMGFNHRGYMKSKVSDPSYETEDGCLYIRLKMVEGNPSAKQGADEHDSRCLQEAATELGGENQDSGTSEPRESGSSEPSESGASEPSEPRHSGDSATQDVVATGTETAQPDPAQQDQAQSGPDQQDVVQHAAAQPDPDHPASGPTETSSKAHTCTDSSQAGAALDPVPPTDPCVPLEGYTCLNHLDHYGDDLLYAYTEDPDELASMCLDFPSCMGFNHRGYLKTNVSNPSYEAEGGCLCILLEGARKEREPSDAHVEADIGGMLERTTAPSENEQGDQLGAQDAGDHVGSCTVDSGCGSMEADDGELMN